MWQCVTRKGVLKLPFNFTIQTEGDRKVVKTCLRKSIDSSIKTGVVFLNLLFKWLYLKCANQFDSFNIPCGHTSGNWLGNFPGECGIWSQLGIWTRFIIWKVRVNFFLVLGAEELATRGCRLCWANGSLKKGDLKEFLNGSFVIKWRIKCGKRLTKIISVFLTQNTRDFLLKF